MSKIVIGQRHKFLKTANSPSLSPLATLREASIPSAGPLDVLQGWPLVTWGLSNKKREMERERQAAASLPPPCAAHLPWALIWNQPAKQPGYLAPTAALSTLPPPQVRKPNGEEGLGMTAARVPCCLPQQQAVLLAGSPPPEAKSLFHIAGVRWKELGQLLKLKLTSSLPAIPMATHSYALCAVSA